MAEIPNHAVDGRGFAGMDPARQRQIAAEGGRAAHEKGTAHEFTPDEARAAGRKGGEVVSRNREHMAAIGREGGQARSQNLQARKRTAGSSNMEGAQGGGYEGNGWRGSREAGATEMNPEGGRTGTPVE